LFQGRKALLCLNYGKSGKIRKPKPESITLAIFIFLIRDLTPVCKMIIAWRLYKKVLPFNSKAIPRFCTKIGTGHSSHQKTVVCSLFSGLFFHFGREYRIFPMLIHKLL